ncbi:hypothetical protein [Streptomyces triculaminicus]|uniref:hypothetical protein n=1 Tax=Streptomyces triculaminicus TaxID=2816232 RepID=UPI0037D42935
MSFAAGTSVEHLDRFRRRRRHPRPRPGARWTYRTEGRPLRAGVLRKMVWLRRSAKSAAGGHTTE